MQRGHECYGHGGGAELQQEGVDGNVGEPRAEIGDELDEGETAQQRLLAQ